MRRFWALWLGSIVFKIASVVSITMTVWALIAQRNADLIANLSGGLIPTPTIVLSSLDLNTAQQWQQFARLGMGIVYALGFYAAGQLCTAVLEMKRESELLTRVIISRLGKRSNPAQEPSTAPTLPVDWQVNPNANRPLGYSRRYRPPAPEIPNDDPRHVRVYAKRTIVTDAPESRIPRPKPKG